MELSSSLTLEMFGKPFLLEKRIALLYAIEEHGSISKAAKAVPMSYKSAWEAVDAMNNLASEPIVEREIGGKNGGGTTITPYGERLLETYRILKEEHTRFLERLSSLQEIETGELATLGRLSLEVSARNQLQAEICSMVVGRVNVSILLRLNGGHAFSSVITKEAVERLGLVEGQRVVAIFKSNVVKLHQTRALACEENILSGLIVEKIEGSNSVEVHVDVGEAQRLVAVLDVVCSGTLKVGEKVYVEVSSCDVMLGC